MSFGTKRQPSLGHEPAQSRRFAFLSSAIASVPLVVLGCAASPKLASHVASTMRTADPNQTSRQTELASAPAVPRPEPSASLQGADAAPEPSGAPPPTPAADTPAQPQPATPSSSAVPPDDCSEPLARDGPPKFNLNDWNAGERVYGAVRVGWSATRLRRHAGAPRSCRGQVRYYLAGSPDGPGIEFWFTIKGGVVTAIRSHAFACRF